MAGGDHRWPNIAQALKRGQLVTDWVNSEVRANSHSNVPVGQKKVPGQQQRVGRGQQRERPGGVSWHTDYLESLI